MYGSLDSRAGRDIPKMPVDCRRASPKTVVYYESQL